MSGEQNLNPWKRISSSVKYSNPWITVREDQVIRPDGKPGIYGVVEAKIAVAVVAVNEQDEVYCVGQYRYPVDEYTWEIVEGGAETGENPVDTARRELEEEVGVLAEDIVQLGAEVHLSNCFSTERGVLFLARRLREVQAKPEDVEVLVTKKIPLADLLKMVNAGDIKDALSIIAVHRAARELGYV